MMAGKFKEYNWRDILQLIYVDAGIPEGADQRTHGQLWHVGSSFQPPEHESDTIIRIQVYDKPFSERIKDHAGE